MNDHIDSHYELHLLIFKMSNGSSYYAAYKRLLTPPCKSIPRKERKLFLSFSLSLSLSFTFSILLFDSFFHIIYQSKIYFISTTLICIIFVLVLQHQTPNCFSKTLFRLKTLPKITFNKVFKSLFSSDCRKHF